MKSSPAYAINADDRVMEGLTRRGRDQASVPALTSLLRCHLLFARGFRASTHL